MPLDQDLTEFTTASQTLISYNYTDISSGTGIIVYFGAVTETSSGVEYTLLTNPEYSTLIEITETSTGTREYDFDLPPFNASQRLSGTAQVSAGLSKGGSGTFKVQCQIKKWDGSSETNISSLITSQTLTGTGDQEMVLMNLPLTDTNFAIGDTLRITMTTVAVSFGGPGHLGTDPIGRDGTLLTAANEVTTQLKFNIPFKLDL